MNIIISFHDGFKYWISKKLVMEMFWCELKVFLDF